MVKLFFGNRSFALLFLPVVIAGLYALNYFFGDMNVQQTWKFGLLGEFEKGQWWFFDLLAPLFIFGTAVLINGLFNRNEFMDKNNYLASLLYVLFMSFLPSFYYLSGLSLAQPLLVFAAVHLFRMKQNEDARKHSFNAAFLYGVACIFMPSLLLCTPILFSMIWVIRPFVWRESVLVVLGLTGPLFYSGVYNLVMGSKVDRTQFDSGFDAMTNMCVLCFVTVLFLMLLSTVGPLSLKLRGSSIRIKKLFRILLLMFVLSSVTVGLEFLMFGKLSTISIIAFPFMFIFPYAFGQRELRLFPTIIFYLGLVLTVGKFFISYDDLAAYLS